MFSFRTIVYGLYVANIIHKTISDDRYVVSCKDNDYEVWTESSITYTTTNQQLLILFGFVVEI